MCSFLRPCAADRFERVEHELEERLGAIGLSALEADAERPLVPAATGAGVDTSAPTSNR